MDLKRKLFIYDRKEVGILILLGVGVALFAFTLGLHLGKQVNPVTPSSEHKEETTDHSTDSTVHAAPEVIPPRSEIAEEVKNVRGAVEDTLDQTLRDEVTQAGIKVATPRPTQFPNEVKSGNPPTEKEMKKVEVKDSHEETTSHETKPSHDEKSNSKIHYALQAGSFPKMSEAETILQSFTEKGLSGEIKEVEINGKGKWFRVLLGDFASISEADRSGKALIHENKIKEFVVVKVK